MKILIFTEGTILMHKNALRHTRNEIVQQVIDSEESVHDYSSYIPIGSAVNKLATWQKQGAEILYLTSRIKHKEIMEIQEVLNKYKFPLAKLLYRKDGQEYQDIAEVIVPDILIEDDCESIGEVDEMTITHTNDVIKKKIKSVLIKEFGGIDYLPNSVKELMNN